RDRLVRGQRPPFLVARLAGPLVESKGLGGSDMRHAIVGSALFGFVVLASCGGSSVGGLGGAGEDSGTPDGGGNLTAEQACTGAATALCAKVESCAPFLLGLLF